MAQTQISGGVVHALPVALQELFTQSSANLLLWENLTPLARNEWICWIQDAKKNETKNKRIQLLIESIQEGKKRPCCWPGCSHRKTNEKKI